MSGASLVNPRVTHINSIMFGKKRLAFRLLYFYVRGIVRKIYCNLFGESLLRPPHIVWSTPRPGFMTWLYRFPILDLERWYKPSFITQAHKAHFLPAFCVAPRAPVTKVNCDRWKNAHIARSAVVSRHSSRRLSVPCTDRLKFDNFVQHACYQILSLILPSNVLDWRW